MTWTPPSGHHEYDALFLAAASAAGTDPALVKAHAARESSFVASAIATDPNGVTQSYGLMQLEYATAQQLGYPGPMPTDDDRNNLTGLYDPGVNVPLGAQLIAANLEEAISVDAAISAYNAGFSSLRPGDGPRTSIGGPFINQDYVDDVEAAWQAYRPDFPAAPVATAGKRGNITLALLVGIVVVGLSALVLGVVR